AGGADGSPDGSSLGTTYFLLTSHVSVRACGRATLSVGSVVGAPRRPAEAPQGRGAGRPQAP
ncbi:MAG: hypothetical protein ACT4PT_14510, partial [Methanobacteriota archaeon]